jgi:hypothetical protein
LTEAHAVTHELHRPVPEQLEADSGGRRSRACGLEAFLCERGQVEVVELEVELVGVELGDEQQILDEPPEAVGVATRDREEFPLLVREVSDFALENQMEIAVNRGQRCPQLV